MEGGDYIYHARTSKRYQFNSSSSFKNNNTSNMCSFNKVFVVVLVALYAGGEAGHLEGLYGGEELLHGGGELIQGGGYGEHEGHEEHYEHPKYQFNYAVHDPHTGDEKQHIEERDGDEVKGTYTLKEADGTTRVVEYKADKHNGFNAVVHKIGTPHHVEHGGNGGGYGGHY